MMPHGARRMQVAWGGLLAAGLLLGLWTAHPSIAQPAAAPDAPASAELRRGMARVETHIADLRRRLRITPAEQPQWDAFATVMRQNAQHMEALHQARAAMAAPLSALDDLRSYADMAQAHAADVQRLVPPFEALYGAMTPDQRGAADRIFQQFQARRGQEGRGRDKL